MENNTEIKLGSKVKLALSDEAGVVKGLVNYLNQDPMAYVMYLAGDGRQVTDWWFLSDREITE